jgi:hypothetical protein
VCGLEFPDIEASLWQPYMTGDVIVIGIDPGAITGDDTMLLQAFIDQTGITFPIGIDVENSYDLFLVGEGISPYPLDIIIAPDGTIAYTAREYDGDAMRSVIDQLIAP